MYSHVKTLAEAEKKGIEEAGGSADLYQIEETLPEEVLSKMYAPPKDSSIPTLSDPKTLEQYDAFLFGVPTRFGNYPAQFKVRCFATVYAEDHMTDVPKGILGQDRWPMVHRRVLGQVRWCLLLDRNPGRWAGGDYHQRCWYACAPWNDLCSIGLQDSLRHARRQ